MRLHSILLALLVSASAALATPQEIKDLYVKGTMRLPNSTAPPSADCITASSQVGRIYIDTNAPSKTQLYICEDADGDGTAGWVLYDGRNSGTGGGGAGGWTDGTSVLYPTSSTADVAIGGVDTGASCYISASGQSLTCGGLTAPRAIVNGATGLGTFTGGLTLGAGTDASITVTFDQGTGTDPTLVWDDTNARFVFSHPILAGSDGVSGLVRIYRDDTGDGTDNTLALNAPVTMASDKTVTFQDVTGTVYVTGGTDVAVADGGTGLSSGNSGGVLYFSSGTALASSAALAANQIILGGGAGVAPATLGSLGTTTTVLHGNAAGAPTFAAVNVGTEVTGTLALANGGTNKASGWTALDCVRVNAAGTGLEPAGAACGGTGSTFTGDTGTASGATVAMAGGTNGIDTAASGATVTFNLDSSEAGFIAAGAPTCGAATAGKIGTTAGPVAYCDNTATPVIRYAAFGDSAGAGLTGDSATAYFTAGQIEAARGGTGQDTSAATGVAHVSSGTWSVATVSLTADVAGTLPVANGGTNNTAATADATLIGNGTTFNLKVLPSCSDPTTSKLLYNSTTDAFSCGADQSGAGSLTVGDADGTPSYASTSNLQFDAADGLVLTDEGGGVVQLDLVGIPDASVSDTLTASQFVGTGSASTAVDLGIASSEVSGTLNTARGGTGQSAWTANQFVFAASTTQLSGDAGATYDPATDTASIGTVVTTAVDGGRYIELTDNTSNAGTATASTTRLWSKGGELYKDDTGDGTASILILNSSNVSGDVVVGNTGVATVQANAVALTTDTTGNYVTSVAAGTAITCTGCTAAEGTTPSLAVTANGIGTAQLDETANYAWTTFHDYAEISAPAAPVAASTVRLYAKTGTGELCAKSTAGVETCMSAGTGGSGDITDVGDKTSGAAFTDAGTGTGTTLYFDGATADANKIALTTADPGADFVVTIQAATDTLVGRLTTDTLTNKTLDAEGTGNAITLVDKAWLPAAGCSITTASSFWDAPVSNGATPACVTGTNTQKGVLDFDPTTDEFAQSTIALPADWTGAIDARVKWLAAATTGSVGWCVQLVCVADAETDDPAFPAQAAGNCVSDAAKGTTLQTNDAALTGITATGCAAGELMHIQLSRDANGGAVTDDMAGDARLIGVELTLRRAE